MGGYFSHVGVGVMLLGFIASSAYDHSTKVTLVQGVPKKVDDMTITFQRFIPRQGHEKEKMEVLVARAGQAPVTVYPKLFINDRTRQVMANPDIKSSPFQDLYVSPIDFDPGRPRLELSKGESGSIGDMEVKFVDFDLQVEGNALAAMSQGQPVTIGAKVAVTQGGRTADVMTLYRLNPATGMVETPPTPLPSGGEIVLAGLNAADGKVTFDVSGLALPSKLSVDVTRKPLIQLVWFGLYIILIGGILSTIQRFREMRIRDSVASS
ncbi:MAG TPA: cytochrome c-type biogenesis CcmF C-terminal domain-containing protein [Thermoanaerobaculia bacterium]|nr:cytochrome c-type biogenesis CcmF C-terminal domain-containing protein [Thermoanaerobaculia bacterium]